MAQNYKTGLIITGDASGGIRAIKATDDELGKLNQGFERGGRRSKQFTQNINGTSRELQVLRRAAAPIAGIIAGMFAANSLQNQINWADQLQKTNLRIGASTEALSQYNYVAKLSGVEFGQLTTAWQRQTRRIAEAADGTGVAAAALDRLNLSAKELNQLAPEDQFERIAAAMQGVESSSERVRLAQQLWDSEGVKLVQIVNQGTDAMAAMRAEADALGLTISQDTANAMATYNDEVDKLKFAAQGVSQTLLSELVPAMTAGLQNVNAFIQEVGGAEVVVGHLTDGAQVLAALLAGRYAGAFAIATAAKLAAWGQSLAYQATLASMAGVSGTAAASQVALGIATRGVAGAFALVGGPLGAAFLAAGAIIYFREELGITQRATKTTEEFLDDLRDGMGDLDRAAVGNRLEVLVHDLKTVSMQAQETFAQLERLREAPRMYGQGMAADQRTLERQTEQRLEEQRNKINALTASIEEHRARREELTSAERGGIAVMDDMVVTAERLTDEIGAQAKAVNGAAKETTSLANSYENLLDRIQPNRRAARQYAQDVGVLNLALATGRINAVQYMQAMGMLQESFQAAQRETENTAKASEDASQRIANSFLSWETVADNTLRRVDDSGQGLWLGLIDGSESALDTVKRGFQQTLAEIAHMLTTQKLTFQVAGMMGLDTTGMPGGGGGFNLSPGGIGNAWNAVQGGFGGIQWGGVSAPIQGGFTSQIAGTGSYSGWGASASGVGYGPTAGSGQFLGGSTQNFSGATGLASLGAGFAGSYAGTEIGSSVFGRDPGSSYGAMIGAGAGTYLGGPIGAAIGGFVGGLADSLFGRSKKTFDFDFVQGQHSYVFGDRTSAFGDSGLTALSDYKLGEQQDQLNDMLTAMAEFDNRIAATAIPERFDAMKEAIDGFTHSGPEDLFETRLRAMITGGEVWAAEAVASITDPEKLAQGMLGALQLEQIGGRLGSELSAEIQAAISNARGDQAAGVLQSTLADAQAAEFLHNSLERLNLQFDVTARGALAAAGELSDYAGGVENMAAIQQAYYNTAFTETERLSNAQADLYSSLSGVTDQVPTTVAELRAMVEAQDLNGEASQQLAYDLMALAPALRETNAAVRQAIEQAYQSELGRAPDTAGLEYWFDRVASGSLTLEGALWNISNSAEAASVAAIGGADAMRERTQLELQLLRAQGNANALRDYELSQLAESNRPLQERIWAIEDEQQAMREAERAQQERIRNLERETRAMMSAGQNIRQFVEGLQNTGGAGVSPEAAYNSAEESFLAAISTIYTSDDSALVQDTINGITGIAQQYLSAAEAYGASGNIYQQAQALVEGSLDDLAGRLGSDELTDIDPQLQAMIDQLQTVAGNTGLSGPLAKQVPLAQTFAEFFGGSGNQNYMVRQIGALADIENAINNLELIVNVSGSGSTVGGGSGGGSNIDTSPSQPVGKTMTKAEVALAMKSSSSEDLAYTFRGGVADFWSWTVLTSAAKHWSGTGSAPAFSPGDGVVRVSEIEAVLGFDEQRYLELNPDIAQAVSRGDFERGLHHYLEQGINEGRKFAKGGVFTNSIVSSPTLFDMGLMGESGDEAIMPLTRHSNGSLGVRAELPMPQFPLLGQSDVTQVMRDMQRTIEQQGKTIERLLGDSNTHLAAANNQRGAAATQQIAATKEGNKMLKKLQDDSRLEAAKR